MKGDKFPSAEMFIGDTKGQQVMLLTSGYEGNPLESLPGDNNRSMGSAAVEICISEKGEFMGVNSGGKTYSVEAWNKMQKANPTGYELVQPSSSLPPVKTPVYGPQE